MCLNYGKYDYEYDTSKTNVVRRNMKCLTNRYENLIINGDLSYGTNHNLSTFGSYNDGYISKTNSSKSSEYVDDFIPIDTNKKYEIGIDLKSSNTSATYYVGILEYDADKKLIYDEDIFYVDGTLAELAEDLNPGDKVVYFKDLSNWNINTQNNKYQRGFHFWNYKDSTGYEYPELTYSQYAYYSYTDPYYEDSAVDKENNTITLLNENGWTGNFFEKGTKVSQQSKGVNHSYAFKSHTTLSLDWDSYVKENITGVKYNSSWDMSKFRVGTKFIRIFMWSNYNCVSNTTTYKKNLFIKEIE